MNCNDKQSKTVPVPQKLLKSMIETHQKWEKFNNEFEDFLLSNDEQFIQKMRKARKEHQAGEIKEIAKARKEKKIYSSPQVKKLLSID